MDNDSILTLLDRLGEAVSTGDMKGISECYAFPVLFLIEARSTIIRDAGQMESMFSQGFDWYTSKGIVTTRAELEMIDEMTDNIVGIDVRWPGFDAGGNEIYSERSHYILQSNGRRPLIRVALTRTA